MTLERDFTTRPLGRFHTQDRFADKYHPLTPYQYAANNPANLIDINGDSIWVSLGQDQQVYYNSGGLYNSDGTNYEGNDKFAGVVLSTLNKMSGTETGSEVLSTLVSSEDNYTFTNESSTAGDKAAAYRPNESGGGGTIKAASLLNTNLTEGQTFRNYSA